MCHLSVTVNLAIVSFTSNGSLITNVPWSWTDRLIFFIVAEHIVYLIMHFIARFVPDVSPAVTLQIERAEYLVAKHLKGQQDKPEAVELLEAALVEMAGEHAATPSNPLVGQQRGGDSAVAPAAQKADEGGPGPATALEGALPPLRAHEGTLPPLRAHEAGAAVPRTADV